MVESNGATDTGGKSMRLFILLLSLAFYSAVWAEDRLELEADRVLGNRDAPKALYIVPWRPLDNGQISGLEIQSLLDEQLKLLDPDQVARQRELYDLDRSAR